jgi:hypothetical protein
MIAPLMRHEAADDHAPLTKALHQPVDRRSLADPGRAGQQELRGAGRLRHATNLER